MRVRDEFPFPQISYFFASTALIVALIVSLIVSLAAELLITINLLTFRVDRRGRAWRRAARDRVVVSRDLIALATK